MKFNIEVDWKQPLEKIQEFLDNCQYELKKQKSKLKYKKKKLKTNNQIDLEDAIRDTENQTTGD